MSEGAAVAPADIVREAAALRRSLEAGFREEVVTSLYGEVERITRRAVRDSGARPLELDQRIDRIVTSRAFGLPLMLGILAVVFWLTIVGANVPLGTGIAFANRYRGNEAVCLTYFGDGAANQGQVYESFNMAKLWKLPVIFIIENNKYAMGTSVERSAATTDFSQRGRSFDISGEQVDGMDVRSVKAVGDRVVRWVREGNGPYILEMLTYRYRGHSMSDPAKYRSREEVQKMREEHDPIEQVKARLLEKRLADEQELKRIDAEIRQRVNEASDFALSDPEPDVSELWTDVFVAA